MAKAYRIVVSKVGLDGHDRGVKVVARALRDAGFEVIYTGLHRTPDEIVDIAIQEDADMLAVSLLSGAHMTLLPRVLNLLKQKNAEDVLLVAGGTIPDDDAAKLKALGIVAIYPPGSPSTTIVKEIRDTLEAREKTAA
jgi:methylmalonyl-CoA mutase C-terminal domain/subunit